MYNLQVEEEMLMRKFYEIMSAHGKVKKVSSFSVLSFYGFVYMIAKIWTNYFEFSEFSELIIYFILLSS